MHNVAEELNECLIELEQLAQRRLKEHSDPNLQKQYEMVVTNAANTREAAAESGWPQIGRGAGLGFSRGIGDWSISSTDPELMQLVHRIDELHRTAGKH